MDRIRGASITDRYVSDGKGQQSKILLQSAEPQIKRRLGKKGNIWNYRFPDE